jgi:hypothetical protein
MTMGTPHKSEPEMDYDKSMSKRHKEHRREVEKMTNPKEKLEKSIIYNKEHAKEHQKALKESYKRLKKMR